jgi:hypothetical protein
MRRAAFVAVTFFLSILQLGAGPAAQSEWAPYRQNEMTHGTAP